MNTDTRPVLVVGGRGKTGRRVVDRLRGAGHAVRIASRSSEIAFDWERPETWSTALEGIRAAYVTYQPDLAVPGALTTVRAFFAQAIELGVTRLVLLSGRGEPEAEDAENALKASGADWTILRASWFAQNFSENVFVDGIRSGELALPVNDVREPFVDVDDIADIAFEALTTRHHSRQLYELTGPEAITFADACAAIAAETGRSIRFISVSPDAYDAEMARLGVPKDYRDLVTYLFTTVFDGRNASPTDGVQRALGRTPRDFLDYVRRTAASGVWA